MIDLAASHKHYLEHLLPVWRELPAERRGKAFLEGSLMRFLPGSQQIHALADEGSSDPVLVAGFDDIRNVNGRPIILMEHGCGQSYGGDLISASHPAYAGGDGRDAVCGFLCPNEYAAARNQERYPDAYVEIIGSPRLAELQEILPPPPPDEKPVLAVSFHWQCTTVAETNSGWYHWINAIEQLAKTDEFKILGHAHPRMFRDCAPTYTAIGVEPVADFNEVLQRAHVYACDNSSTLYEFAAVRGPVVVLDCPLYRPTMNHGLRFWDAADIGPRIIDQRGLAVAVRSALAKRPWPGADEILARVFPPIGDPAKAAADACLAAASLGGQVKVRGAARFPRTSRAT